MAKLTSKRSKKVTEQRGVIETATARKSLLVMSGGLDSTVMAYQLASQNIEVMGIYFDIGYKPRIGERNSARLVAHRLGIALEIVNFQGLFDMVTGFYPTEIVGFGELDKGQPEPFKLESDRDRYVVGFQVILAIATYYAQLARIKKIYTALTLEQYDFNTGLDRFSTNWTDTIGALNPSRPIELVTPFKNTLKSEIIKMGADLNVPFEDTWSCLDGHPVHCGKCSGCVSRKNAFGESKIADPTKYET